MHASDEFLQLPHAGPGFKVFHTWLPVCSNVDVELRLISLGVHQARLAGQDERAQPYGVDLGRSGRGLWCLFSHRRQAHGWPTPSLPSGRPGSIFQGTPLWLCTALSPTPQATAVSTSSPPHEGTQSEQVTEVLICGLCDLSPTRLCLSGPT